MWPSIAIAAQAPVIAFVGDRLSLSAMAVVKEPHELLVLRDTRFDRCCSSRSRVLAGSACDLRSRQLGSRLLFVKDNRDGDACCRIDCGYILSTFAPALERWRRAVSCNSNIWAVDVKVKLQGRHPRLGMIPGHQVLKGPVLRALLYQTESVNVQWRIVGKGNLASSTMMVVCCHRTFKAVQYFARPCRQSLRYIEGYSLFELEFSPAWIDVLVGCRRISKAVHLALRGKERSVVECFTAAAGRISLVDITVCRLLPHSI